MHFNDTFDAISHLFSFSNLLKSVLFWKTLFKLDHLVQLTGHKATLSCLARAAGIACSVVLMYGQYSKPRYSQCS